MTPIIFRNIYVDVRKKQFMIQIISLSQAKDLWLDSQKLNVRIPFGKGQQAVTRAVSHLGYVQIDTINVIERCHHHILFTRIPDYKKEYLRHAQSIDKSIFEYWTHALAYVPTSDYRFFIAAMKQREKRPSEWFGASKPSELKKMYAQIIKNGAITIRDIEDEVLLEKDHPWVSRKPSKIALQLGFNAGKLAISERLGMLKKYEWADRHFNWVNKPQQATETEITNYKLDRALRAQGIASLNSICHLEKLTEKRLVQKQIEQRLKKRQLVEVKIAGAEKISFYTEPHNLEKKIKKSEFVHILSPFDPLTIQRPRLEFFFNYTHRFEAYIPKNKRVFGYFALPILVDDQIQAAIDLKTDRERHQLLIQKWTWVGKGKSVAVKQRIEEELNRFEKFQLASKS
jgi:uncharacterized protein